MFFGEKAGGRIPWPDPDLKPDAERDFPGLVPNHLKHVLKDPTTKAREAIGALTAEVADLREENKEAARPTRRGGVPQRRTRAGAQGRSGGDAMNESFLRTDSGIAACRSSALVAQSW